MLAHRHAPSAFLPDDDDDDDDPLLGVDEVMEGGMGDEDATLVVFSDFDVVGVFCSDDFVCCIYDGTSVDDILGIQLFRD